LIVAVLINEWAAAYGRESLEDLGRMEPEDRLKPFDDLGLYGRGLIVAPARVSAALLHEPLRLYSELEQNDASIRDDTLSGLVDRLEPALRRFRKSVFHVPYHTEDPTYMDLATTNADVADLGLLYTSLAKFFGPHRPSR